MRTRTLAVAAVIAAAATARATTPPESSELRLLSSAEVGGESVRLCDVMNFAAADEILINQVSPQTIRADLAGGAATITHDQVVARLSELGVNLARVRVVGAARCQIRFRQSPPPEQIPAGVDLRDPAPAQGHQAPSRKAGRTDAGLTGGVELASDEAPLLRKSLRGADASLADVLQQFVAREYADLGATPEIEFEIAGQEFLSLTTPPFEFDVRAVRGERVGMREFSVSIRKDGAVQRAAKIAARCRIVRPTVVAKRPLNIGAIVRPEDLGLEPRMFENERDLGLASAEPAIGQQVRRFVAPGQMVTMGDLKPVPLVERSRPVTVLGAGGSVALRMTGVALDPGSYGDTVRVRVGDTRENRRELRGVISGPATVRLAEGGM